MAVSAILALATPVPPGGEGGPAVRKLSTVAPIPSGAAPARTRRTALCFNSIVVSNFRSQQFSILSVVSDPVSGLETGAGHCGATGVAYGGLVLHG